MFRLYVDEVGTDDLSHLDQDDCRYLSLTGVAIRTAEARDNLTRYFDWIKANIFDHDPDEPLIFHRSDIVKKKREFGILNDPKKKDLFDRSLLRAMQVTEYTVITALIDKLGMTQQPHWMNKHPYHYLMEILVEKYTQFLERKGDIGDIMPEGRKGKKDRLLQGAFETVLGRGTSYVSSERMNTAIPFPNLKIRYKQNNIAGLQLCDLLAHPSHLHVRKQLSHDVELGPFACRVRDLLIEQKYDRSKANKVIGYGIKWFPSADKGEASASPDGLCTICLPDARAPD